VQTQDTRFAGQNNHYLLHGNMRFLHCPATRSFSADPVDKSMNHPVGGPPSERGCPTGYPQIILRGRFRPEPIRSRVNIELLKLVYFVFQQIRPLI